MHKQLWIGLAEVRPLPACKLLEEAKGAYVHVMAWANDAGEFWDTVAERAADLALTVVDLRETEPWSIRSSGEDPLREEFFEMAERVNADVNLVAFGRFHAWFQDQPIGDTQSALSRQQTDEKLQSTAESHPRISNSRTKNGD